MKQKSVVSCRWTAASGQWSVIRVLFWDGGGSFETGAANHIFFAQAKPRDRRREVTLNASRSHVHGRASVSLPVEPASLSPRVGIVPARHTSCYGKTDCPLQWIVLRGHNGL